MSALTVDLSAGDAGRRITATAQLLTDGRPLFRALAGALEAETEANFAAQGRPDWVPMADATRRERLARNKGSSVMQLLKDRGILAASISSEYGSDYALIGAGGAAKAYAGLQQFGGTIERPAYSTKTRLRTDRKGNLVRQGATGRAKNLAVFAKDSHKQVREVRSTVDAYRIEIPARPYLPFSGPPESATLQPSAEQTVLDVLEQALRGALG